MDELQPPQLRMEVAYPYGITLYPGASRALTMQNRYCNSLQRVTRTRPRGRRRLPAHLGTSESLEESIMKHEDKKASGRSEMGRTGRRWLIKNASPEGWKEGFENIVNSVIHE